MRGRRVLFEYRISDEDVTSPIKRVTKRSIRTYSYGTVVAFYLVYAVVEYSVKNSSIEEGRLLCLRNY